MLIVLVLVVLVLICVMQRARTARRSFLLRITVTVHSSTAEPTHGHRGALYLGISGYLFAGLADPGRTPSRPLSQLALAISRVLLRTTRLGHACCCSFSIPLSTDDVHERPPAVAGANDGHAVPEDLLDERAVKQTRNGAIECAIAKHDAADVGCLHDHLFQVPDGIQRGAQLLRRLGIERVIL